MSRLKSFAIVTGVTLLIWLWAEVAVNSGTRLRDRDSTEPTSVLQLTNIPVQLAGDPDLLATYRVESPVFAVPMLRLRGPAASLQDVSAGRVPVRLIVTIEPADAQARRATIQPILGPEAAAAGLMIDGQAPRLSLTFTPR
jgi:hypothetical protein